MVLADEFLAKLDRTTAKVVGRLVSKWVKQEKGSVPFLSEHKKGTDPGGGVCWVAASSHDDLLEALEPDVLILMGLGGEMEVVKRVTG